jgi:uncharacterized membrane protein
LNFARLRNNTITVWQVIFAAFFVLGGVMHFVKPDFYLAIMPPWVPFHEAMVIVSGIAEIVLGVALLVPRTRRLAAWGLIALLVAVFPANIQALLNARAQGLPELALWIRLPLQGALIYWAYRYTLPRDSAKA